MLVETLKNLPKQPIKIEEMQRIYAVNLSCKTGRYQLERQPSDFYPMPEEENLTVHSIQTAVLKRALNYTLFVIGKDKRVHDNPWYQVHRCPTKSLLVAMNGTTLVYFQEPMATGQGELSCTLSATSLEVLRHLGADNRRNRAVSARRRTRLLPDQSRPLATVPQWHLSQLSVLIAGKTGFQLFKTSTQSPARQFTPRLTLYKHRVQHEPTDRPRQDRKQS